MFLFSLHGSNKNSGKKCDMKKYFSFCVTFLTVQVKLKLTTWKSDPTNTFVKN